jgi:hypothetical protein
MAKIAARKLSARDKIARQIDLTSPSSISRILTPPISHSKSKAPSPARLITLYGVLPNLDPLPLLRCLAKHMAPKDLLLFSTNLAPGENGRRGARRVLPQYDNPLTHKWLQGVALRTRPRLSPGFIHFGVYPDPNQSSLSRIEARWFVGNKPTHTLFSSRRPTLYQVKSWIQTSGLTRIHQWIEPKGEEGVWLTTRKA